MLIGRLAQELIDDRLREQWLRQEIIDDHADQDQQANKADDQRGLEAPITKPASGGHSFSHGLSFFRRLNWSRIGVPLNGCTSRIRFSRNRS